METLDDFLETIDKETHRAKLKNVIQTILENYPELTMEIKWNQPMLLYKNNGTFILGFSKAKPHFAIAPEKYTLDTFADDIKAAGYQMTKMFLKIKWTDEVNYDLLYRIIDFNIKDKKDSSSFWRR
ncbi:iron chaperone [Staphylococcus coagulans]|uniref:iron chaperone n=1 Tax=Staphylococcus coagulans TaxID=74706 RepID=UPI0030ECF130